MATRNAQEEITQLKEKVVELESVLKLILERKTIDNLSIADLIKIQLVCKDQEGSC